eukprot:TRINITY_DN10533_c0_g1_i1.p1 TRINITY_DN10533_c0_g1~~TRINITY_DN10533_c0_g1_i1.p1  ORF type:complete len:469 (+),score=91.10 TRINITY_DN10533_c0_g1_i1:51-1457(+)
MASTPLRFLLRSFGVTIPTFSVASRLSFFARHLSQRSAVDGDPDKISPETDGNVHDIPLSNEDLRILDVPTNCTGCGAVFQVEKPEQPGYIPSKVAMQKLFMICQRCFHLKHYNKNTSLSFDHGKRKENTQRYMEMLKKIQDKDAVIIKIVDIMDVHGTIIPKFSSIVGNHPIIVIGNKFDILPKDTHYTRIRTWLLHTAIRQEVGSIRDVFLMTATGENKEVWGRLLALLLSPGIVQRDVYVVGVANVGKSTFITNLLKRLLQAKKEKLLKKAQAREGQTDLTQEKNSADVPATNLKGNESVMKKVSGNLIPSLNAAKIDSSEKEYESVLSHLSQAGAKPNENKELDADEPIESLEELESIDQSLPRPTVSPFPGTTLSFLSVPIPTKLNKSRHLIDTPGLFNMEQLSQLLSSEDALKMVPNKRYQPFTARMTPKRVLFVGCFLRFDILGSGRMESYITCFVPPAVC